jgi:hypothetical protein
MLPRFKAAAVHAAPIFPNEQATVKEAIPGWLQGRGLTAYFTEALIHQDLGLTSNSPTPVSGDRT